MDEKRWYRRVLRIAQANGTTTDDSYGPMSFLEVVTDSETGWRS
jgi:hypothetical protein